MKWTNEEIEAMAAAVFWHRHKEEMLAIEIFTLDELQARVEEGEETIWHPGGDPSLPGDANNSLENDPPITAEELYRHEGTAIFDSLCRSIDDRFKA
jgi:hypothetical protein